MKIKLLDKYSVVKENLNYHITENEKIIIRLSGRDMGVIVENIFPLLTGEYSSKEIAEKLENKIPQEQTIKIINNLIKNTIVQYVTDISNEEENKIAFDILNTLTSDVALATKVLQKISIGLIGDVPNLQAINRDFNRFNFKKVVVFEQQEKKELEGSLEQFVQSVDFIIAIDNSWRYSKIFSILNEICLKEEKAWLYSKISNSREIMVGPIFTGKKVCYECLIDRFRSNQKETNNLDIRDENNYEVVKSNTNQNRLFLTELKQRILIETIKYLLNVPSDNLVNEIEILDILNFTKKRYPVLPVPKCRCNGEEHLLYRTWEEDVISYEKMLFSQVI